MEKEIKNEAEYGVCPNCGEQRTELGEICRVCDFEYKSGLIPMTPLRILGILTLPIFFAWTPLFGKNKNFTSTKAKVFASIALVFFLIGVYGKVNENPQIKNNTIVETQKITEMLSSTSYEKVSAEIESLDVEIQKLMFKKDSNKEIINLLKKQKKLLEDNRELFGTPEEAITQLEIKIAQQENILELFK